MTNYTPNHGGFALVKFRRNGSTDFALVVRRETEAEETRHMSITDWQTETPSILLKTVAYRGTVPSFLKCFEGDFLSVGNALRYDKLENGWDLLMERDEYECDIVPLESVEDRIKLVEQAIDEAVGRELATFFPEAATGDIEPLAEAEYATAVETLVDYWVNTNVPQGPCSVCRGDMTNHDEVACRREYEGEE